MQVCGVGTIAPAPSWIPLGASISRRPDLQKEVIEAIKSFRANDARYRTSLDAAEISIEYDDGIQWSGIQFKCGLGTIHFLDVGGTSFNPTDDLEEARSWDPQPQSWDDKVLDAMWFDLQNEQLRRLVRTAESFVAIKIKDNWRTRNIRLYARPGSESAPYEELPSTMWRRAELDREFGTLKSDAGGPTFFDVQIEAVEAAVNNDRAVTNKRRGRPSPDRAAIIAHGMKLMEEKGAFATNQSGWSGQADLERALMEFAEEIESPKSESTIRVYAQNILKQFHTVK